MRKLILTILLASSVAMPAMAQERGRDRDRGARQVSSDERKQAREERRSHRAEQRVARQPEARQQAIEPRQRSERVTQGNREQRRAYRDARRPSTGATYAENGEVLSQQRDISRTRNRSLIGQVVERARNGGDQVVVQRHRDDRSRSRYSGNDRRWNNHWRGDRNYDWRNHRNRHRSIFRLGNYWDPYGSRYRRFSIGFSLFPSYYQSNFWLNDPWQYRLPPAYGPYRWVRYYNDALLVDIYTGQVVDVEYNVFW